MAVSLPVRFRREGVHVAVETDSAHAPLRDFLINDLGENIVAIVRAKGRASGDPYRPWQASYRYHLLDYDGSVIHVRDVGGWTSCDVHPVVFRQCLEEYLAEVGVVRHRKTLERLLHEGPGAVRFTPDRELPVSFRVDGPGDITVIPSSGNEHLVGLLGTDFEFTLGLDWLIAEFDRADPHITWPGRVYRVEVADGVATIDSLDGTYTCLDAEIFRQALAAFRQARIDSFAPPPPGGKSLTKPPAELSEHGEPPAGGAEDAVAASLALGDVLPQVQGWRLIQMPRATLEDMAGLIPHPDACLPHGVMGTGSGACWADLAVLDVSGKRLRSGTKTFMPRGIDAERLKTELSTALTQAGFLTTVPGAWSGVVAGVPVHGYVDPDKVRRLPFASAETARGMAHVRVFFPALAGSGVDLEAAASRASGMADALDGPTHVLTAFLLHDVQSHRHHLDVVRAARPGWEHSGNACHLALGARTVRLRHLWLDGHACEMPTNEFARVIREYERLLTD